MNYQYFNPRKRKEINGPSAVALHYEEGKDRTPRVVAQGNGLLASKIIELARENNVPLQEDPLLIENLIDMDLGDSIPPQLYMVVAEILLMIEEMERKL